MPTQIDHKKIKTMTPDGFHLRDLGGRTMLLFYRAVALDVNLAPCLVCLYNIIRVYRRKFLCVFSCIYVYTYMRVYVRYYIILYTHTRTIRTRHDTAAATKKNII